MKKFIILFVLFCTACSGSLSKRTKFDSNSPKGVVVIGMFSDKLPFEVRVRKYDNEKKITYDRYKRLLYKRSSVKEKRMQYYLLALEPGRHVVQGIQYVSRRVNITDCFGLGAPSFEVKPGELLFLGNIEAEYKDRKLHAKFNPGVLSYANQALDKYPKINGVMKKAKIENVTFPNGRAGLFNLGIQCGGDRVK